ncbi:MAG: AAA family ATPase [Burkholderiaceae bacterium]
MRRATLADTIWADLDSHRARANLRRTLFDIRQSSPYVAARLGATREHLCWQAPEGEETDVQRFVGATLAFERASEARTRMVFGLEAATLYAGDLLADLPDPWIVLERQRLMLKWLALTSELVGLLAGNGDLTGAIALAERIVTADPGRESATLMLMRLHRDRGDLGLALQTYDRCAQHLSEALGVEPGASLKALRASLTARVPDDATGWSPAQAGLDGDGGPPFVGRSAELKRLLAWGRAVGQGGTRLALISGEPGVGRSRLAGEGLDRLGESGIASLRVPCDRSWRSLPYAMVAQWLRAVDLHRALNRLALPLRCEIVLAFPDLVAWEEPVPALFSWPANRSRRRLFEALLEVFRTAAGPRILFIDELQDVDADSLDFLRFMLHPGAGLPVAVLAATEARSGPSDAGPAPSATALAQHLNPVEIDLSPLSATSIRTLVARLRGGARSKPPGGAAPGDAARVEAVVRLAQGVPLFAIELARLDDRALDSLCRSPVNAALPDRLRAALSDRLADLPGQARLLAEQAAVFAGDVPLTVLEHAC